MGGRGRGREGGGGGGETTVMETQLHSLFCVSACAPGGFGFWPSEWPLRDKKKETRNQLASLIRAGRKKKKIKLKVIFFNRPTACSKFNDEF